MNDVHALSVIAVIAAVTAVLRFLPFAVFGKRTTPGLVTYLGTVLPYAAIGMLVVYCLKDMSFTSAGTFFPQAVSGMLVLLTYIWKRNSLVSIVSGTVCYMLLVQAVF